MDIPQPQSRGKIGKPMPVWRCLRGSMRHALQKNALGIVACLTADVKLSTTNGFVIG